MLRIRAKTGPDAGITWKIGAKPLVIGREKGCDIRVLDLLASRRHCELLAENDGVRLRDLKSRNATLVNGEPVEECLLNPGDEFSVGHVTFEVIDTATPQPRQAGGDSTLSITEGETVYLSDSSFREFGKSKFTSVGDVLKLFSLSRTFSRMKTMDELVGALTRAVCDRLHPLRYWLALSHGDQEPLEYPVSHKETPDDTAPPPETTARQVMREMRGFLIPERTGPGYKQLMTTLAAPIFLGERRIGAMVAQTETPHGAYDEGDLHFLVALANAFAPFYAAIENRRGLEMEVERLRLARSRAAVLVGGSAVMQRLRDLIAKVAPTLHSVLIIGETGTGKELVARLIHDLSHCAQGPLITVNCAAIPNDLIESELFGYEKGAFTGALARKTGLFELSDGGTLFLDEVGDLSPESQARILRAIETKRFRRVGGREEVQADFRIVAATNKNISDPVRHPEFRRDLYHRLRGVEIRIPPLRDRKEDIEELAEHFLNEARGMAKRPLRGFAEGAIAFLRECPWPGNVRELKYCVEAAITFGLGEFITVEDLKAAAGSHEQEPRPLTLAEVERRHILRALDYCNGRVVDAARLLGISKTKLYERLAEYRTKQ